MSKRKTPREIEGPRPGAIVDIEITGITTRGQGHAVLDPGGRALEVPGLVPGDRASVRIEALARWRPTAHGRLRELGTPSPQRREIACPRHRDQPDNHGGCTGCPLMALDVEAQRGAKAELLAREYGFDVGDPGVFGRDPLGYRWSSKRVVAGRAGALVFGSREAPRGRGSKPRIADMRGCLVDHPTIVAVYDALRREADTLGVAPWSPDPDGPQGDLRYLWAKTDGERVLLTLIGGSEQRPITRALTTAALAIPQVVGVAWGVQPGSGNAIRSALPLTFVGGAQTLRSRLAGVDVEIGPLGFLQPNPELAADAYRALVHGLDPEDREDPAGGPPEGLAYDLYAGAGVTTELLRRRFTHVVPCESYPESARALGVEAQTVEAFLAARLEPGPGTEGETGAGAGLDAPGPALDLIVANPPRAGLGEAVCGQLRALAAPRIHIMSCNPATLAIDLEHLAPSYRRTALWAFDTLPHTAHVELVVHLEHI